MSEHKIPIPSMIYNAAVGGHVTNSQQIIDENLNREQQDINEEIAAVPYNVSNPNGMGKIVLKKNDNFKQVVEAQTNGNTIFVIKYDFTLTGDVTIPVNCILEFDGGSISNTSNNNYTIAYNNTTIKGFGNFYSNITCLGTCANNILYLEYYGDNLAYSLNKIFEVKKDTSYTILLDKDFVLDRDILIQTNTQMPICVTLIAIGSGVTLNLGGHKFYGNWSEKDGGYFPGGIKFVNIRFEGQSQIAFYCSTLMRLHFDKCFFYNFDNVFYADINWAQTLVITNCYARTIQNFIKFLVGAPDIRILNTTIEASNNFITAKGITGVVSNCCIEGLSGTAFALSDSVDKFIIRDNYFESNNKNIDIYGISGNLLLVIEGNNFYAPTLTGGMIIMPHPQHTLTSMSSIVVRNNCENDWADVTIPMFIKETDAFDKYVEESNNAWGNINLVPKLRYEKDYTSNTRLFTMMSQNNSPTIFYPLNGRQATIVNPVVVDVIDVTETHTFALFDVTPNSFRIALTSGDPDVINGKLLSFIISC